MNLTVTTLAAIIAVACLDFATASPPPTLTGLAARNPVRAILKRGAHLVWHPAKPWTSLPHKKRKWERTCDEALTKAGCDVGTIHLPQLKMIRNGHQTYYVNVEGASSMDTDKPRKKMRVFQDSSAELLDDWPKGDRKAMADAKRSKKKPQARKSHKTLLSWVPADAYKGQPKKKVYWEHTCDQVLNKVGCTVGVIHPGETKLIRDGKKTSYINVEAGTTDMKHSKKMHVFQDGSSEDVNEWSTRDRKRMSDSKRAMMNLQPEKKSPQPQKEQKALLSWDPPGPYKNQQKKKLFWEQQCDEALARDGCAFGVIHQGETRLVKDGQKTSYINLEGATTVDMKNPKKMRVYLDGSVEHLRNWPSRDRQAMWGVKRKAGKDILQSSKSLLFWQPAGAYKKNPRKRVYWENRCDLAFAREGCDGGTIHKGKHKLVKPDGEEVYFVNVEGALGTEYGKKMRVFQDGSSEVVADVPARGRKSTGVSTQKRRPVPVEAEEASAGSRAPTRKHTRNSSKRRRVGGDEYQYSETQAEIPERFQTPRAGGFDLNFPPTGAASPERSHAPGGGE